MTISSIVVGLRSVAYSVAIAIYQRQLNTAIKRARFLALVPYSDQHKI